MATGTTFAAVTEKRLFGTADMRDRLLGHLRTLVQESFEKSFRGGCVYDTALDLISGGNDKVTISGTSLVTDGQGHLLDVATSGYATALQFQNTAAVDYEVGLHYAEAPSGVQVNPRTGQPEWIGWDEAIGESGNPDLVTDNGNGTITFRVNSVTESGVSNAGRLVRVYKDVPGPNATTDTVAIEELTVSWTGSQNEITTVAAFGQDTVSTTAGDYTVVLMGPTIKRNTTLYDLDGYAFLGTVTGGGAGSPPSGYDITDQDVIDMSLSDLADITSRNATTDRLKIDVKSYSGDVNDPQIQVRDPSGTPVFTVDGNGNVVIEGTTTQEDFVEVNASETITDNLTAGDDDATDSHKIKGEWWHTNNAETANHFRVDGDTGRIGIGKLYDTGGDWPLDVGVLTRIATTLRMEGSYAEIQWRETAVAPDAGGLWTTFLTGGDWYLQENTAAAGDFSTTDNWLRSYRAGEELVSYKTFRPSVDDGRDLGTASFQWRNLYVDGTAYVDTLSLSTTGGEGIGTHAYPTATGTYNLGSNSYSWLAVYTETAVARATSPRFMWDETDIAADAGGLWRLILSGGDIFFQENTAPAGNFSTEHTWLRFNRALDAVSFGHHVFPSSDDTYDLGSASYKWANIYVTNLNVGSDILPAGDLAYNLGSSTLRWLNLYVRNIDGGPLSTDFIYMKSTVQVESSAPQVWWRDTTQAIDDGGLLRIGLDGGIWYLQENLAAGGDFSSTKTWMNIDTSTELISLGRHVLPTGDAAYNLGSSTNRWADVYALRHYVWSTAPDVWFRESDVAVDAGGLWRLLGSSGDIRLQENTAAGGDFSTQDTWWRANRTLNALMIGHHTYPITDDAYDLGSSSKEWRNLHIDGFATIDTIYLSNAAGEGCATAIVPIATNTYDLGSGSYVWRTVYTQSLSVASTAGHGVSNHLVPYLDDTRDLGNATYQWKDLYIDGVAYIDTLSLDASDDRGIDSTVKPTTDDLYNLGSSTRQWRNLYLDGTAFVDVLSVSTTGGEGVGTSLIPTTGITYNLGSGPYRWNDIYCEYVDSYTYTDTTTAQVFWWSHYAPTVTNQLLKLGTYEAATDGTPADGLGWYVDFNVQYNTVAKMVVERSDADTTAHMYWRLWSGSAFVDQLALWYNGGISTRTVYPWATATYDLGSASYWWQDAYLADGGALYIGDTDFRVGNASNPRIDFDAGDNDAMWYDRTLDAYVFRVANTTRFWFDANTTKFQNDVEPWADITYALGTPSYRWGSVATQYFNGYRYIDTVDAAVFTFQHYAPTVTASGLLVGSFLANTDGTPADGFGGILRFYNSGNHVAFFKWSRQDADDTANLIWYIDNGSGFITSTVQYYSGDFGTRNHIPLSDDAYDLGSSGSQWRNLYIDGTADFDTIRVSNIAGEGVDNHLSPASNATYTLGNSSYYWSILYANRIFSTYTNNDTEDAWAVVDRWTTTGTNTRFLVAEYDVRSTQTLADGFGGKIYYNINNVIVADLVWGRRDANDQCDLWWALRDTGDVYTTQLRVKYDGGIDTRTILPMVTNSYDLGSSSYWWQNAYIDGTAYIGDSALYLQINGGNPFLALDANDAFWYSRSGNRFYWRIDSDDTIFSLDATNAEFAVNVIDDTGSTHDLGNGTTGRWRYIYGTLVNTLMTSTAASSLAFKFSHDGDTTDDALLKVGDFRIDCSGGTQAAGFGGYLSYYAAATQVGQWVWSRDGADDQYDFTLWSHDGTSLTARMKFYWDDWIGLYDHTQFFDTVYVFKDTISTGELVKFQVPYSPAAVDGALEVLYVTGGTSSFPQKTRYLTGIESVLYGCGHTSLSSIVYGVRSSVFRDLDENDDNLYAGYFYAKNLGTGGTGVDIYGIRSEADGTDAAEAYGIYAYAHEATVNYGVYGIAQNGGSTYGLFGSGSGGSGSNYGLYVPTGTKTWVNPHPTDPTKAIVYSTVEADRDTALLRGRAQLVNGRVTVVFPEHYAMTLSDLPEEPVHVIVTPRSADSKGLAVVSSNNAEFEVVELADGIGNYEFDYVVTGARRGYEEKEIIIDNVDYIPGEGNLASFEGEVQEYYDRMSPGIRRIFKSSGILNAQGKINAPLFARKNWRTGKIKKPGKQPQEEPNGESSG